MIVAGHLLMGAASAAEWPLSARALEICLPASPSPSEEFAAEEMQAYFRKMSGVEIAVRKGEPSGEKKVIFVGRHSENKDLWEGLDNPDHYILDGTPERLRIVGGFKPPVVTEDGRELHSDWGVLYGAYQLLGDQGIRWLRPEPEGEEVPKASTLQIVEGRKLHKPAFAFRWGVALYASSNLKTATPEESEAAGLWALRNRSNVLRTPLSDIKYGGSVRIGGGGHVYSQLVPKGLFAKHPEFFPLINGKRVVKGQLCLGNPDLQEYFAKKVIANARKNPALFMTSIDPNDGGGWCECDKCQAMDDPGLISGRSGAVSMSTRVMRFNNIIGEKVRKELPELLLYCLAYAGHTEAPKKVDTLAENLIIGLAPFAGAYSDYSRPLRDPQSLPNRRFMESIKGYSRLNAKMYAREYLSHYAWPGPLPLLWTMQDRFKVYRDFNFTGVYSETHPCWGPQGMVLYMYLRLLWDPDLDLKAEVADYCRKAYGPAAAPMQKYHELIEKRGKGGPYFGSGGSQAIGLFTDEFLDTLAPYVKEAKKLAQGHAPYEWRIETVLAGYDFARLYRHAVTELSRGKPKEAKEAIAKLEAFYGELSPRGDVFDKGDGRTKKDANGAFIPPSFLRGLLADLAKIDTIDKQFKNPRLLQMFDTAWKFKEDANGEGVASGWDQPSVDDAGWAVIKSGMPWQHQGFSDYHGTGWYRRQFPTPSVGAGQKIMLIFDGVDGDATVWVNGKQIGHRDLIDPLDGRNHWDDPFMYDLTEALNSEGLNSLVVRVTKMTGNAGIHRSVKLFRIDGTVD